MPIPELQQPDILGNYLSNYRQSQQYNQAQQDRQLQQQRVAKQDELAETARRAEMFARDVLPLDTPEKWAANAPVIAQKWGYGGAIPGFAERERILSEAMSVKDMIEQKMQEQEFGLKRRVSDASIRASNAQAAHSNAETQALLHPGAGGAGIDNKTFDNISSLRKEYIAGTKDFGTVRDAYSRIRATATANSAGGDIALVYAFMKMLDPGSVVRETEFATAQNATGVPDRIRNMWNNLLSGQRLNQNQRQDFLNQANSLYRQQNSQYENIRNTYSTLATNLGLDPKFIVTDQTQGVTAPPQQPAQAQTLAPGGASAFGKPDDFSDVDAILGLK